MRSDSADFMEHVQDPRNRGTLPEASRAGVVGVPGRGPYFTLYLKLNDGCIEAARFQCHGCGATVACGSLLTEMIIGISLERAEKLTAGDLEIHLHGLPVHKRHCAATAIAALKQALDDRGSLFSEES